MRAKIVDISAFIRVHLRLSILRTVNGYGYLKLHDLLLSPWTAPPDHGSAKKIWQEYYMARIGEDFPVLELRYNRTWKVSL